MANKKNITQQLTIPDEVEKRIKKTQTECRHKFGLAMPSYDFESDRVYYFAICTRCGYQID